MFCEFETIQDNVHKCKKCGFQLSMKKDPSQIKKACSIDIKHEPSALEKTINFLKATVEHAADGASTVSVEEENKRKNTCQGNGDIPKCEFFDNNRCGKCGCGMMSEKWKWKTQSCPIGKW